MQDSKLQAASPVVIVVEDDDDLLKAIAFSFQMEGYEVRPFASAEALLAEPDFPAHACLVVDHHLPGMDGLDMLGQLRARGPVPSAVLMTTPNATVTGRALEAGVRVVEKPLMERLLIDEVERQLADGRRPAA